MNRPSKIVLASRSPRRAELLRRIIPAFEIDSAGVDESRLPGEEPGAMALRLAEDKAGVVLGRHPDALVVAGDTVVVADGEVLGQPDSPDDAIRMLELLSGRRHEVLTAVCLRWAHGSREFVETSTVEMLQLSREWIDSYVTSGEPMDKAGSYAIQGGAGNVARLASGFLSTVVGLPVERLSQELADLGYRVG